MELGGKRGCFMMAGCAALQTRSLKPLTALLCGFSEEEPLGALDWCVGLHTVCELKPLEQTNTLLLEPECLDMKV